MKLTRYSQRNEVHYFEPKNDEVYLSRRYKQWPIDRAEKLLASSLPWGPSTYALGIGSNNDQKQPDQSSDFLKLAEYVDGAYERNGNNMSAAWDWAKPIIQSVKSGGSRAKYPTQDLLDILFLHARGERFSDGLIRSAEPMLREMVKEIIRRVNSATPPVFLVQK